MIGLQTAGGVGIEVGGLAIPFVHLLAGLIGALTVFVVVALRVELDLPWTIAVPITLPAVIAGIALARAIAIVTNLTFVHAMIGLGIVLYVLAGGYEIVKKTPG